MGARPASIAVRRQHSAPLLLAAARRGKGSGLGLSQVLGVAKQLGGGVHIETRLGAGTTVKVYLPCANGGLVSRTDGPTEWRPDAETDDFRRVIVLLVDDAEVRAATAEMLRYAGHDVIEAGSGREALDCLEQHGDRIDLMIADYVMPGMNGVEVARLGRLRRPSLPIMFITGFRIPAFSPLKPIQTIFSKSRSIQLTWWRKSKGHFGQHPSVLAVIRHRSRTLPRCDVTP